ncbi:MAG: antitoxin family protein, partial [bacterium]
RILLLPHYFNQNLQNYSKEDKMEKTIEAIYQNGIIKPLERVDLPENERIKVTIQIRIGPGER